MAPPKDMAYYDLLGVSATATDAEIRKAYRLKALQCHPDRAGNSAEATAAFQHLKAVYEILSDADRREAYDEDGPPSNLHGDDDDACFDVSELAAFFKRNVNPVTAADIAAYEKRYRNGEDEREDLVAYFSRYDGDVVRVVDYIPYSDDSDIGRFIEVWDAHIDNGTLSATTKWKKARKTLVSTTKKVKPRNVDEDKDEGEDLNSDDDDEIEKEEGDTKKSGKVNGKGKGKKKKGGKKGGGQQDDMAALVANIQARRQRGKDAFDAWAQKYEALGKEEEEKSARKAAKRKSQGSTSDLKAEGGVKKKKRSK